MARTIRVGDIGDYANSQMEKLLRSAVLETDALLKSASPVDTGRFRASWASRRECRLQYDRLALRGQRRRANSRKRYRQSVVRQDTICQDEALWATSTQVQNKQSAANSSVKTGLPGGSKQPNWRLGARHC
jgi:hypothetical protein